MSRPMWACGCTRQVYLRSGYLKVLTAMHKIIVEGFAQAATEEPNHLCGWRKMHSHTGTPQTAHAHRFYCLLEGSLAAGAAIEALISCTRWSGATVADQGTSNMTHHGARSMLPALENALLPSHIAANYNEMKRTAIKRCAFLESGSTLYRNGMRRFFSPGVAAVGNALMKVLLARNCRIFFACLQSVKWRTVQKRVHPLSVTPTARARK